MNVNPLEAVLSAFRQDHDLNELTGGRVAAKHKFGKPQAADRRDKATWPVPSPDNGVRALTVMIDPSVTPDIDGVTEAVRIDCRCYAASQEEAYRLYQQLASLCDDWYRQPVGVTGGLVLVYDLWADSGARLDRDPDTNIDFLQVYLRAIVGKHLI